MTEVTGMHSSELRAIDLLPILLRRKAIFLVLAALIVLAGFLLTVFETARFRATVTTVPASVVQDQPARIGSGQFAGIAALAGVGGGSAALNVQESIAVLMSRSFTQRFIEQNQLMPILFAEQWDSEVKDWDPELQNPPSLNDAYRVFDRAIRSVERDDVSGIIKIHIEWTDPALAAEWANGLVRELNARMRERAIEESKRAESFLLAEADRAANLELKRVIFQLMESNVKKVMYANVYDEYALKVIDPAVRVDPEDRVNMSRRLKLVLSLALGIAIGILGALGAEAVSRSQNATQ